MQKIISSEPQASLLLHSLRSVGYTEEAAIADIVDNSISAGASIIDINFDWDNRFISIVDNGQGMQEDELYKNMQIGSANPDAIREEIDLGRFGMGMKTAAFSLGKEVVVITSYNGEISNAAWDLDKVDELGWNIIVEDSNIYDVYLSNFKNHGTAVLIRKLDNLIDEDDLKKSKRNFYLTIERVKNHLQLVFHRFIDEDNLKITLNGITIESWDPFITNNPATQELADEEVWDPEYKTCTYIQPFVLPHKTKFADEGEYERAGGYRGWSRHQGIYVYRNRRLIIYGTWFDLIRKEPAFNLARIKIDISSNADFDWKIDIKKSKASLPVYIREKVLVAVEDCTMRSTKVFNSRGSYTSHGSATTNLDYVWEQSKKNGFYVYKINKKHPLLADIRKQLDSNGNEKLRAYLSLIENFAPFMQSGILNTMDSPSKQNDQDKLKDLADIENYIKVYKELNFTNDEIVDTLSEIAMYHYLKEDIKKMVEGTDDK